MPYQIHKILCWIPVHMTLCMVGHEYCYPETLCRNCIIIAISMNVILTYPPRQSVKTQGILRRSRATLCCDYTTLDVHVYN